LHLSVTCLRCAKPIDGPSFLRSQPRTRTSPLFCFRSLDERLHPIRHFVEHPLGAGAVVLDRAHLVALPLRYVVEIVCECTKTLFGSLSGRKTT
jgi:hypothetical protein